MNRFLLAWKVLRGLVSHIPAAAPCEGCAARNDLITEYKKLLESERAARAEDRRVHLEMLQPGLAQRLAPPIPRPVVPEPEEKPGMPSPF